MKLSAKLSAPIFFAFLIPPATHGPSIISMVRTVRVDNVGAVKDQEQTGTQSKVSSDSVPFKVTGGSSPASSANISSDSAAAVLKATHAQVFFLNHVRSPKKALSKLAPGDIISIEVAYGDALIKQYGADAKDGVCTVLSRVKTQSADASKNKSKNP
jgi:hypothetical protein